MTVKLSNPEFPSLSNPEFPSLSESADRASAAAQRNFLILNQSQLILLTTAAFASGLGFTDTKHQKMLAWAVFAVMLSVLGVTTSLRIGKFDDRWFRCRAFAENLKSTAWYFIMSAQAAELARVKFLDEVRQLNERLPDLQSEFARFSDEGKLITDWMRASQALPIPRKVKLYQQLRLADQVVWYSRKAKLNSHLESVWFRIIFCVEFIAVVCTVLQATQLMKFNPVSGVAAIGTALIAWSQIKRFSDLGTSYAIAAGDLQRISEVHRNIQTQAELDLMVREVETAVSREHSMWLARRLVDR